MFLDTPYYLGPDGPVAEEGFAVLREAMRRSKRIAIGRVMLSGKERLVAVKPQGKGIVFFTLRYLSEVRQARDYFADIGEHPLEPAQISLAQKLIESNSRPLNLANFTDRYQAALLELIKAKLDGAEPVLVQRNGTSQVLNLLEALQQSLAQVQRKPHALAHRSGRKKVSAAA
jgi:DNA end-binding protein Ku